MRLIDRTLSQILVVSTYFVSNSASAFLGADLKLSIASNGGLVHKTSVIGTDDRLTFEADAKGLALSKVESMFGATGVLNCDEFQDTAQVTESRSVITTAGHLFFDGKCNPIERRRCYFFLVRNGEYVPFKVKMSSVKVSQCDIYHPEKDWTVMELEEGVPSDVSPYKLPSSPPVLTRDSKVIQVSGFSHNFQINSKMPRYVIDCSVRDVFRNSPIFMTDCDSGTGASGSALLQASDVGLAMVGIHLGTWGNNGEVDGLPYVLFKSTNYSIPVDGDLRAAVEQAVHSAAARSGHNQ